MAYLVILTDADLQMKSQLFILATGVYDYGRLGRPDQHISTASELCSQPGVPIRPCSRMVKAQAITHVHTP